MGFKCAGRPRLRPAHGPAPTHRLRARPPPAKCLKSPPPPAQTYHTSPHARRAAAAGAPADIECTVRSFGRFDIPVRWTRSCGGRIPHGSERPKPPTMRPRSHINPQRIPSPDEIEDRIWRANTPTRFRPLEHLCTVHLSNRFAGDRMAPSNLFEPGSAKCHGARPGLMASGVECTKNCIERGRDTNCYHPNLANSLDIPCNHARTLRLCREALPLQSRVSPNNKCWCCLSNASMPQKRRSSPGCAKRVFPFAYSRSP